MLALASIGALTGVMNSVLSANGNIWTFLFGIIDVTVASYVAFDSSIRPGSDPVWGISRFTPLFPADAVRGLVAMAEEGRKVPGQGQGTASERQIVGDYDRLFLCGTAVTYFVLNAIGGAETAVRGIRYMILFDALVFVLNVLGQVLMSLAFVEQWIVWILVNVFSILLWSGKASSSPDTSYTVVMVIKYSFYFLNSLNGLRIWLNLSRESR